MSAEPENSATTGDQRRCLGISVQAKASHLRASDGREIPFTRAILAVRNECEADIIDFSLHITLGQEGGTVQDVTHVLTAPPASLPPGGGVSWDVYDLLLPAHPGTASKVHMFGYRAALNWRFDLAVWAAFRRSDGSQHEQTPVSRWALRWHLADTVTGAVELAIEEEKELIGTPDRNSQGSAGAV
jgi:hypothetical protein